MAHLDAYSRPQAFVDEDVQLRKFFSNVFLVMAAGLTITGAIAFWLSHNEMMMAALFHLREVVNDDGKTKTAFSASGWWWTATIIQFGLIFVMAGGRFARLERRIAYATFALYAALTGFTLAPVLHAYTDASIAKVFFIAAATFGGSAVWGRVTKRNITKWGSFLRMALIGMLVALVVNIFFSSPAFDFVVSIAGVLLFAGLTAYDVQKLEKLYDDMGATDGLVVYGALTLYLDFINLFLFILRLFGIKKD